MYKGLWLLRIMFLVYINMLDYTNRVNTVTLYMFVHIYMFLINTCYVWYTNRANTVTLYLQQALENLMSRMLR